MNTEEGVEVILLEHWNAVEQDPPDLVGTLQRIADHFRAQAGRQPIFDPPQPIVLFIPNGKEK